MSPKNYSVIKLINAIKIKILPETKSELIGSLLTKFSPSENPSTKNIQWKRKVNITKANIPLKKKKNTMVENKFSIINILKSSNKSAKFKKLLPFNLIFLSTFFSQNKFFISPKK